MITIKKEIRNLIFKKLESKFKKKIKDNYSINYHLLIYDDENEIKIDVELLKLYFNKLEYKFKSKIKNILIEKNDIEKEFVELLINNKII